MKITLRNCKCYTDNIGYLKIILKGVHAGVAFSNLPKKMTARLHPWFSPFIQLINGFFFLSYLYWITFTEITKESLLL